MNSLLPRLRLMLAVLFAAGLVGFAVIQHFLAKRFQWVPFAAFAVLLAAAMVGVFLGLRREVQKREQSHAKNHELRQTFETLTHNAPAGIFRANQQGDILFVNNRWSALTGRSQAECQGFGWLLAVHPDDNKKVTEEWRKCVRGEKEFHLDFRVRNKDGSIRWLAGHAMRVLDDHEQPNGILGSVLDITGRKLSEDARATDQAAALDTALARVQQEVAYHKDLGQELERRTAELKKREAELESANRQLWAELSGREQVEAELNKVRDEIEQQVTKRTAGLTEVIAVLEQAVAAREQAELTLQAEKTELQKLAANSPAEVESLRKRLFEEVTRRQLAEDYLRALRHGFDKLQSAGAQPDAALQAVYHRLQVETARAQRFEAELETLRASAQKEHHKADRADAERELSEQAMLSTNASLQQRLKELDDELERTKEELITASSGQSLASFDSPSAQPDPRLALLAAEKVQLEQELAAQRIVAEATENERVGLALQNEAAAAARSQLAAQLAAARENAANRDAAITQLRALLERAESALRQSEGAAAERHSEVEASVAALRHQLATETERRTQAEAALGQSKSETERQLAEATAALATTRAQLEAATVQAAQAARANEQLNSEVQPAERADADALRLKAELEQQSAAL